MICGLNDSASKRLLVHLEKKRMLAGLYHNKILNENTSHT